MERKRHEYVYQLADALLEDSQSMRGVIPRQNARAAAGLLDEYADLLKDDRISKLENALRGIASELEDGTLCWCSVAAGIGEEHASFCLAARDLTLRPAGGIITTSQGG